MTKWFVFRRVQIQNTTGESGCDLKMYFCMQHDTAPAVRGKELQPPTPNNKKNGVDCPLHPLCPLWTLLPVWITAALCAGAFMLHCSGLSARIALGCLGPAAQDSKSSRVLMAID